MNRPTPAACLIEYMPCCWRASHEAAGNSGVYPHNGSVRYIIPAEAAGEIEEGDEWVRIVRQATPADFERYEQRDSIPWGE